MTPPAASLAVELRDVVFRWQDGDAFVLELPELVLAAGERLFVHGPSGSGKSTLLNLIGGVVQPARGEVRLLGQPLAALGTAARDAFRAAHTGFIFQQFNLIPYLSVLDNVPGTALEIVVFNAGTALYAAGREASRPAAKVKTPRRAS